jgi:hypothetical protein
MSNKKWCPVCGGDMDESGRCTRGHSIKEQRIGKNIRPLKEHILMLRDEDWCYDVLWGQIAEELGYLQHTQIEKEAILLKRMGIEDATHKQALESGIKKNLDWARTHPEEQKRLDVLQQICNFMTQGVLYTNVAYWQKALQWLIGQQPSWAAVYEAFNITQDDFERFHKKRE